jgi:hypothetical protein
MQAMQVVAGVVGPEGAMMLAQKKLNLDKVIDWAWDLFNNPPDLMKDEEDLETENQKAQAMQALQMAGPSVDIANKGAGAVKQIADAQASGGIDIPALLASMQQQAGKNPAAAKQITDMMNGFSPTP